MKRLILATLCIALLCSCGGSPKIDGTSMESFEKSIQAVTKKLSDQERKEFVALTLNCQVAFAFSDAFKGKNPENLESLRLALHGKTAQEAIAFMRKEVEREKLKKSEKPD